MNEIIWTLILVIKVTGMVSGLDIDPVATFKSEEACEVVAEQLREIHLKERDKRLIALCVPDRLEHENTKLDK